MKNEKIITKDEDKQMLISFKIHDESYAVHIEKVKEITLTPKITRIPKTPSYIKGVANIRGEIIPVIDLEEKLNLKVEDPDRAKPYTIVAELEEMTIGLIVQEVPQSVSIFTSQIQKNQSLMQEIYIEEDYIHGLAKVNNSLLIVLDIEKILAEQDMQALQQ